jgi:hypothetical protein
MKAPVAPLGLLLSLRRLSQQQLRQLPLLPPPPQA